MGRRVGRGNGGFGRFLENIGIFGCSSQYSSISCFYLASIYTLSASLGDFQRTLVNGALAAASLIPHAAYYFIIGQPLCKTLWCMVLRLPPRLMYLVPLLCCCCILTPMDRLFIMPLRYCSSTFGWGVANLLGRGGNIWRFAAAVSPSPAKKARVSISTDFVHSIICSLVMYIANQSLSVISFCHLPMFIGPSWVGG